MPRLIDSTRRYAALARAVARARRAPFDPFKLTWILTEECSCRCRTCHLWADAAPAITDHDLEQLVAHNRQLTWMNLSGGDLVEDARAPGWIGAIVDGLPDLALLDLPTAGLDTDATLAALEPALASDVPRIYITVSIDGPDAVHDRIRGVEGAAERARATYRALSAIRRRGFSVAAGMTLSRHSVPATLDDISAHLPTDIPLRDLHLNIAHHSSHYYRNPDDVAPPTAAAQALIDHVRRRRPWRARVSPLGLIEERYWTYARRFLERGDVGGRCAALRASVFVAPDLTVLPCSIFERPLGNLADVGYALRDIPQLPGAQDVLADVEAQRCPRCWSPCEAFPTLLAGMGRVR